MKIAVFVSGNGTNLQALIDAEKNGELSGGKIVLCVSDKVGAYALERAEKEGIKCFVLEKGNASSGEEYDGKIAEELEKEGIELVLLAGFMRILSANLVKTYAGRIMNIHPSLLPEFKGTHGIRDAFLSGTGITGVTVHFVTEALDAGPIIMQKKIAIEKDDTLETLEEKIHKAEHEMYPEAVRMFIDGKL